MFRTVPKSLSNLYLLIMSSLFHTYLGRDWLREFAGVLALNAPLARRSRARNSREAAFSIAWYLGQLVQDPEGVRREEEEDRARRKAANISRHDDDEPIEHKVEDAKNINILAFRLLVAFGVLEQMRDAFPLIQSSDQPLFTEEAWPTWWQWASEHFFTQTSDVKPTLENTAQS
jgi:hypothetical protein